MKDNNERNREKLHEAMKLTECDGILFQCFDEGEAKALQAFAKEHYPHRPVRVTWMDFK